MEQPTHNALFTTASGVVGGACKAITTKPLLLAITFSKIAKCPLISTHSAHCPHVTKKLPVHSCIDG